MKKDIARIFAVLAGIAAVLCAVDKIGHTQRDEEAQMVREAIRNAAMTCWCIEGMYPESLTYLKDHYHLSYNEDRFFVTYDAFASNQVPIIYVTEKGAGVS
ncbi:MAG: hypothetical protein IKE03_05935 [Blautia sp.]|nr:hypothetical protein [Blautia sp.]